MKDEQKLNLLRLAINNASDFDEAKSYASFILGDRIQLATCTPRADNSDGCTKAVKEGGVYIVAKGLPPVPFGAVGVVHNPKKFDVMVSYHGHEWIVAKNDVLENGMHLLKNDANVEVNSPFCKSDIEAFNDFNMKFCTNHLRKLGLYFNLDDDLYIPTVGQLAAMYLYREELNEALKLVRGTPMKEGAYWSSNEYGAWNNWGVNFGTGNVGSWTGKFGSLYVRPCMAFELKKK